VTEVPEHLLRRSRERREALGLAGGSSSPSATEAPAAEATEPVTASAPATVEPAPAPAPAPAEPAVEEPVSSYIAPDATRSKIPVWVMPVLAVLPFWGILYVGAFGERAKKQVVDPGQAAYAASGCGSCHGTAGEGGVGPALAGGQSKLTFPNEADHVSWVRTGSAAVAGQTYGDPNRPGGPRTATGGMPGFGGSLSEEEILAVVKFERDRL
jgi:mono/diheme cytochrome c family protein